ncbi:trypsin-like serine protease [Streptomyces thinghirensis]|nr:trypsin-like serine protease [Streptomyces thinghirensis]
MTSTPRRARLALPAATAALALSGAVLAAAPAQASDTTPVPPQPTVTEQPAASRAELLQRVKGSGAALKGDTAAAPGQPKPTPSAEAPSTAVDPKIIGGKNATISEAPWMVQLHYYDDKGTADPADDDGYFCGGTLVAPAKVLTAAHCVYGLDWSENGAVLAGTAELPEGDDLHGGRVAGVWRQWVNPTYRPSTIAGGDLAVLTLTEALPYKTLRPTSSSDTASYANGTPATVYGWGAHQLHQRRHLADAEEGDGADAVGRRLHLVLGLRLRGRPDGLRRRPGLRSGRRHGLPVQRRLRRPARGQRPDRRRRVLGRHWTASRRAPTASTPRPAPTPARSTPASTTPTSTSTVWRTSSSARPAARPTSTTPSATGGPTWAAASSWATGAG